MTRGQTNMAIGASIFALGAVVTAATYSAARGGGVYVVAYGAIAAGAWQFLRGLFQWISDAPPTSERESADTVKTALTLALHAMSYIASGDGKITAKERDTIDRVLRHLLGQGLPDDIGNGLEKMAAVAPRDYDLYRQGRLLLPEDAKELAFKCALLVGLADGEVVNTGFSRLRAVGDALGISSDRQALIASNMVEAPKMQTTAAGDESKNQQAAN